jgi:hypothetical protein
LLGQQAYNAASRDSDSNVLGYVSLAWGGF